MFSPFVRGASREDFFRALLEETEHIGLLLDIDMRWLSRERFLDRFRELFSKIKELLKQFKNTAYVQL